MKQNIFYMWANKCIKMLRIVIKQETEPINITIRLLILRTL